MLANINPSFKALSPVDPTATMTEQVLVECRMALKDVPAVCAIKSDSGRVGLRAGKKLLAEYRLYRETSIRAEYICYDQTEYPQVLANVYATVLGLSQRLRIPLK